MKDRSILRFLKISRTRFISTANKIPDPRWRQSPTTDVWSAAEILAHPAMIGYKRAHLGSLNVCERYRFIGTTNYAIANSP